MDPLSLENLNEKLYPLHFTDTPFQSIKGDSHKADGRVKFSLCDTDVQDAFVFDMVYTRGVPPVVTKNIWVSFYLEGIVILDGFLNYTNIDVNWNGSRLIAFNYTIETEKVN